MRTSRGDKMAGDVQDGCERCGTESVGFLSSRLHQHISRGSVTYLICSADAQIFMASVNSVKMGFQMSFPPNGSEMIVT